MSLKSLKKLSRYSSQRLPQMSLYFMSLGACLLVTGCAHHRDVRAGADGIHRVLVQAEDTESGSQDAIRQANHFCEERGLNAAFIDENKKYTGSMSESDYNTMKTAGKVAEAAGGAAWVFGGKRESNAGGIVGLGGGIARAAAGKGYTIEMKFKCQ